MFINYEGNNRKWKILNIWINLLRWRAADGRAVSFTYRSDSSEGWEENE